MTKWLWLKLRKHVAACWEAKSFKTFTHVLRMSKSFMHIVDWFKLERLWKVETKKSRNYVRQTFTHLNQSWTLSSDSKQQLGAKCNDPKSGTNVWLGYFSLLFTLFYRQKNERIFWLKLSTKLCYSYNKITTTWIQISRQNWNGFFSNDRHQIHDLTNSNSL